MFSGLTNLGSLFGLYSGSPLMAAAYNYMPRHMSNIQGYGDYYGTRHGDISIIIASFFGIFVIIALAAAVLMVISWWKIFEKTGRSGWPAIVPVYNLIVIFQIVGMSPWLLLLALIPFLGSLAMFVVMIFVNIKLAKAFGKDEGFAVGLILLPIVFVPILAFGQAKFAHHKTHQVGPTTTV